MVFDFLRKRLRGTISDGKKNEILRRQHFRCHRCGKEITKHNTIHHIVSFSDGGSDDITNLEALCLDCHDTITKNQVAQRAEDNRNGDPNKIIGFGKPSSESKDPLKELMFGKLVDEKRQMSRKNTSPTDSIFGSSDKKKGAKSRKRRDSVDAILETSAKRGKRKPDPIFGGFGGGANVDDVMYGSRKKGRKKKKDDSGLW